MVFNALRQGWRKQFHIGQANSSSMDIHVWKAGLPTGFREPDVQVPIVQSTISMQSMLMLGGSGGMPPRKCLKNMCSEIEFGSISGS